MVKLNTDSWIKRAKEIHGDIYDYSKTIYTNSRDKVIVICPIHGDFIITASAHTSTKRVRGCPKCGNALKGTYQEIKSIEQFITDANKVHNNKYDYSLSNYTGVLTELTIICKKHNVAFLQTPANHLKTKHPCKLCLKEASIANNTIGTSEFIKRANKAYNNKYDYSKVVYTHHSSKVTIICPIHGEFEQSPACHLKKGSSGCPECSKVIKKTLLAKTTDQFIREAKLVHGDKYNYTNTVYSSCREEIKIICPEHGEFLQVPSVHLHGSGCSGCAKNGFQPNIPGYLYYLKVTTEDNQVLYKIGITNRTVNERFNLIDLNKIEIIKQKLYEKGQDALDWETKLKREYKQYQYKGPNVLESGNTELFTEDIIAMWENN